MRGVGGVLAAVVLLGVSAPAMASVIGLDPPVDTAPAVEVTGTLAPDLRAALDLALGGKAAEAAARLRTALAGHPASRDQAPAYEVLGVALFLQGDEPAAIDAMRRSVALDPDRASALTKLGSLELDAGALAPARTDLERAVAADPGARFAHQRLAELLDRSGNTAGAIREYRAALGDLPPDTASARVELAQLYNREHRFAEAIALLQPVTLQGPETTARLALGTARLGAGDPKGALEVLRAGRDAAPKDPEIALAVGVAERAAGQLDASRASIVQAATLRSGWAEASYQLGLTDIAARQYPAARAALQSARQEDPGSAVIQRTLARALLLDGQPDAAITALRALAARDDAGMTDLTALATAYQQESRVAEAEQVYRDGVRRFPREPEAYRRLGAILALQRRYPEALAVLRQGGALAPDDPLLLRDTALVQDRLGSHDASIATAQHLVALDHGNADGQFLLASLIQDSGDAGRAMQAYRDVLAIQPNQPWALNNLAAMLLEKGDAAAALPLAQHAAKLQPHAAAIQDTLGWALLKGGHPGEAVATLTQAHALAPSDPHTLYGLALAQKATGDVPGARRSVAQALATSPGFHEVDGARTLQRQLAQ